MQKREWKVTHGEKTSELSSALNRLEQTTCVLKMLTDSRDSEAYKVLEMILYSNLCVIDEIEKVRNELLELDEQELKQKQSDTTAFVGDSRT